MWFLDPRKLKNRTFDRCRDRKRDEQAQWSCIVVPILLKSHDFSSKTVVWTSFLDQFLFEKVVWTKGCPLNNENSSKKLVQTTVFEEKSWDLSKIGTTVQLYWPCSLFFRSRRLPKVRFLSFPGSKKVIHKFLEFSKN